MFDQRVFCFHQRFGVDERQSAIDERQDSSVE